MGYLNINVVFISKIKMAQSEIHVNDGKSNGFIENDNNISDIKREDKDITVDYEYKATRSYASSYSPTSDNLRRRPLQTYEQREKDSSPKVETSKSKSSNKLSGKDKCRVVFFVLFILLNAAGIYLICVESDSAVKVLTELKRDVMNNFFTGKDQSDVASTDAQESDESVKIVKGFSPPEVKTEPDLSTEEVGSVSEKETSKSELPEAIEDEVKSSEPAVFRDESKEPATDKISVDNDETTTEPKDTLQVAHTESDEVKETYNALESDETARDATIDANIASEAPKIEEAETKDTSPPTLQEENAEKLTNVPEETGNEPSREDIEAKDSPGETVQEGGNDEASNDVNPVEQQDITAQVDEKEVEGTHSDESNEAQSEPIEEEPIIRMKRDLAPPSDTEDDLPVEIGAGETSTVVQSEHKDTSESVKEETTEQTSDTIKEVAQSEPVEEKTEEQSLERSEDDINMTPSDPSKEEVKDSEQPMQDQQPSSHQETSPEEVQSIPPEEKHDTVEDSILVPPQNEVEDIPGEPLKEEASDAPVAPVPSQVEAKDVPGESLKEETSDAPVGEVPDQTNEVPVETAQDELKEEVGQHERPDPKEENADDGPTVVEQEEPSVQPKTEDELTKAGSSDENPSQVDGPTTTTEQEL